MGLLSWMLGKSNKSDEKDERVAAQDFLEAYNKLCDVTGFQLSAIPVLNPGSEGFIIHVQMQVVKKPPKKTE